MLYNPKWDTTDTDIFALDRLIAWLEKQPADGVYDYTSATNCLLSQFLRAQGWKSVLCGPLSVDRYDDKFYAKHLETKDISSAVKFIAQGDGNQARHERCTFGAALERAKAERR
jgi:hypothetical protein